MSRKYPHPEKKFPPSLTNSHFVSIALELWSKTIYIYLLAKANKINKQIKPLEEAKAREKMTLDFNPQLLKASEKFLDDIERECKRLNRDQTETLKEVKLLQNEIDEIMNEWEV